MKERNLIQTTMTLILALAICIIPICTPAETASEPEKIPFSATGVEMELPAVFTETEGVVAPAYDMELDTGIYIAGLKYFAFPEEKYTELNEKQELTNEEIEFQ